MSSFTVAVAGGTGGLGRSITEAIIADGKYEVVILSRKADEEKANEIGARIISADYTSVEALTKLLEDNKIQTVVSTLQLMGGAQHELNLVVAADRSSTTRRYVPSTWVVDFGEEFGLASYPPSAKGKEEIIHTLQSSQLEFTSWNIGLFTDYYVAPHVKSHLSLMHIVLDMESNAASIPGSGNVPLALTYSQDVANFVAASLSLAKWEPKTYLIGDRVTWNELVALAEAAKGVKFNVAHDPVELLREGKTTELPGHKAMYPFFTKERVQAVMASFGEMFDVGIFDLKAERTIDQEFPDIKRHSVKELLTEAWAGK
ncbi:hypothetical protein F5X68DRAFT_249384 [Plectosphaerella plurivora]|uniref:NmrA-like domain-containing protein n=1 Tax=Plectosphaerella plurivora TaxID=936078 RepID=A0A9P8V3M5_9PEZI|nr:hypothetical protein F5X68DRAFT_249384 [Plectosphaerella plurivora]